jgi:DNA-binding response OmpR family regulator
MAEKVLLLEDDADTLEMLAMAASILYSREVLKARNYAELTQLADTALACEVAVLDINLGPQQPSGLDAYRWLREHGYQGRVYFLTGHARSHPLVAQALAMGDAKLLEKPIAGDQLSSLFGWRSHEQIGNPT